MSGCSCNFWSRPKESNPNEVRNLERLARKEFQKSSKSMHAKPGHLSRASLYADGAAAAGSESIHTLQVEIKRLQGEGEVKHGQPDAKPAEPTQAGSPSSAPLPLPGAAI